MSRLNNAASNIYLSEFVAESKVNETLNRAKHRMVSLGYNDELINKITNDLRYKLYGKLNTLSQTLTEPMFINPEENWEEWMYGPLHVHTVSAVTTDWGFDLHIAIMRQAQGYIIHCFTVQMKSVVFHSFFFDNDLIMNRVMSWTAAETAERKLFTPHGTNCFLDSEPRFGVSALVDPHHFDYLSGSCTNELRLFTKSE